MKYEYVSEIPKEYQILINHLIENGIISADKGKFEYPLNPDILFTLKIICRLL